MDKAKMVDEKIRVVEWTIENFSCWNRKIHAMRIESPESLRYDHRIAFHLFPKGLSGNDKHLVVDIFSGKLEHFSGELSFIGSDGSLLYKQQVDLSENQCVLHPSPGPEFQKVVSQIRKNETFHQKDRLTLRLCLKNVSGFLSAEYMRTTIDAFDAIFKVSPHILKLSISLNSEISWLYYPLDEMEPGLMTLLSSRDPIDFSKIELALDPHSLEKKVSVLTRITVLNHEGDVVKLEENEHMFREKEKWIFSSSLTDKEVSTEGFSVLLKVKIIPCNPYKNSVGLGTISTQAVDQIPLNGLRPPTAPHGFSSKSHTDIASNHPPENSLVDLSKKLSRLYQTQDFSDLRLKSEDVSFKVHKAILSARSPVFKTMLASKTEDSELGITDLDAPTLGFLLTYLYTGTVEDLQEESSLKLYKAAEKYQVPILKRECVDILSANVSISNVCDVLSLAVRNQDQKLTSAALKFVLGNYDKLLKSKQWKDFTKSEPLLVAQTMTLLAEKISQKQKAFIRN